VSHFDFVLRGTLPMKIQAAVSREGARYPQIEMLDIEEPRPGEILVRIVASGICHTDIGVNARPGPRPFVLGHEGAGIVERTAGVTELAPGDHVVLSVNFCGECPSCKRNAHSYCYEVLPRNFGGLRPDGTSPLSQSGSRVFARFFGQSSFATYSLADARCAIKVPNDVPLEILAPLGCGVQTGAGAIIHSLRVGVGDSVAIFGVGSVGLAAVMAARLVGAERIIAVDLIPSRLAMAKELGATDTIDASNGEAAKIIRELTGYGVSHAFNTANLPASYTQSLECLAPRGIAGFVAPPNGQFVPDMFQLLSGGRALRGILGGDTTPSLFIPMLIDYYRQGRFPFDRLIKYYAFERVAEAFEDSSSGRAIKPVLRMPS
jgi:aryl-alcohol dehydrogenase